MTRSIGLPILSVKVGDARMPYVIALVLTTLLVLFLAYPQIVHGAAPNCSTYYGTVTGYLPVGDPIGAEGTFGELPQDDGVFTRFSVAGFETVTEFAVQDGTAISVTFFDTCGMTIQFDADPIFHDGVEGAP